jgi:polysaccharide export outer membrane protein
MMALYFDGRSSKLASNLFTFAGLLLAASLVANAQFIGTPPSDPPQQITVHAASPPTASDLASVLLAGDSFEIQLFGVPQFDYKGRIEEDGSVSLPFVGKVILAGKTVAEAENSIAKTLADAGLINSPQVYLHVLDSPNHSVTVTGEIRNPGPVQIYGDKYLLDVLSAVGGLTPLSSPVIEVYRRGSVSPLRIELPTDASAAGAGNIRIDPGDTIIVSRLGVVYAVGAFHQQGAIPLRNNAQTTLIEAISLAGGVNYEAALRKAFILRNSTGGRVEISFDVGALIRHRIPDMSLQNEDIILIPTNRMKAALKGGASGVAASLLAGIGYITVR